MPSLEQLMERVLSMSFSLSGFLTLNGGNAVALQDS